MTKLLHPRLVALESSFGVSELIQIDDDELSKQQLQLWIKRDDLLHPIISGNKWRKLKYILDHALTIGADALVSMGGAYSNHLHAMAFVGENLGIKTIGYIRGERPEKFNPTLIDLETWGMELRFVSRTAYRDLRNYKHHDSLPDLEAGQYWLPEGGAIPLALKGVGEIIDEINVDFDHLLVACGTGATLAGLIAKAPSKCCVSGVAALKGAGFLQNDVKQLVPNDPLRCHWQILLDYHFGGFAKSSPKLNQFIQQFEARHSVPLEPVYTGKLLYAVNDLLNKGYFSSGQRIIVLHTGGLQGSRP